MDQFLSFTILGLVTASIYAVAASGLVVTYTTSGIFNFAHGAVSMLGAFMYWQLAEGWGLPTVPSILLVLLVFAPLFGFVIERVIMRGLEGTSDVTKTIVTVGLLFGLIALAPIIWPPTRSRTVSEFWGGAKFQAFDAFVSYHQVTVIVIAVVVAIGLRLLLFGTRAGISMRAVVSNRQLVQLNGGRPSRASAMSWALGSSLAALAGILIADRLGLSVLTLTLLVLNAYAAAIVGRLVSLPMTFLGAVILGLAQSYAIGYMPRNPGWLPDNVDIVGPLRLSIPVIMLFIVLLLLPQPPLRTQGLVRSRESVLQPTWRLLGTGVVVLVGGAFVASRMLSSPDVLSWSRGLGLAIIMLSLVPLTGYGGQISLAPMAFAGLGAVAMSQWGGDGTLLGLLLAFLLPAAVGALVALPALRLQGIYLALATFAFAVFMERAVFIQQAVFPGGSRRVPRLDLGPLTFEDDRAYMVLMAAVFSVLAAGVVALRLGPFGRRLQAMKDSPAACATLGLNLTVTKVQVFALSAGIAGIGGAMFAGLQQTVSVAQFEAIQSLPVVLLAVAGGIALVSGALVGGLLLASLPIIANAVPSLANLLAVAPGLIGIGLGRNPNGMVHQVTSLAKSLVPFRRTEAAGATIDGADRPPPSILAPVYDAETVGLARPFTDDDLVLIDRMVHIHEEEVATGVTPRG
jgi:branched-chain amino acid transport system permease protein